MRKLARFALSSHMMDWVSQTAILVLLSDSSLI